MKDLKEQIMESILAKLKDKITGKKPAPTPSKRDNPSIAPKSLASLFSAQFYSYGESKMRNDFDHRDLDAQGDMDSDDYNNAVKLSKLEALLKKEGFPFWIELDASNKNPASKLRKYKNADTNIVIYATVLKGKHVVELSVVKVDPLD